MPLSPTVLEAIAITFPGEIYPLRMTKLIAHKT